MAFDLELYGILAKYIKGIYEAFSVGDIEDRLFK